MTSYINNNLPLRNISFVLVGRFPQHTQSYLANILQGKGATVFPSLTRKNAGNVQYIVYNAGKKVNVPAAIEAARELRLPIISFDTLSSVLNELEHAKLAGLRLDQNTIHSLLGQELLYNVVLPDAVSVNKHTDLPKLPTYASECADRATAVLSSVQQLMHTYLALTEGKINRYPANFQKQFEQTRKQAHSLLRDQQCAPFLDDTIQGLALPTLDNLYQHLKQFNPQNTAYIYPQVVDALQAIENYNHYSLLPPASKQRPQAKNQYLSPVLEQLEEAEEEDEENYENYDRDQQQQLIGDEVEEDDESDIGDLPDLEIDCGAAFNIATSNALNVLNLILELEENSQYKNSNNERQDFLMADQIANDAVSEYPVVSDFANRDIPCPKEKAFGQRISRILYELIQTHIETDDEGNQVLDQEGLMNNQPLLDQISSTLADLSQVIADIDVEINSAIDELEQFSLGNAQPYDEQDAQAMAAALKDREVEFQQEKDSSSSRRGDDGGLFQTIGSIFSAYTG